MLIHRHLRSLTGNRLGLTIPALYCEMLDYNKGLMIYACLKGNVLILDKKEKSEDDGYDLVIGRKLIQMGHSKSLIFPIPNKLEEILKYYKDQEIGIELKAKRLYIYKLWGE